MKSAAIPARSRVLSYCLKAILLLCLLIPLYRWALPSLEWSIVRGASLVLAVFDPRARLSFGTDGTWRVSASEHAASLAFGGEAFRGAAFLSLLVLASLIIPMQLSWKTRFKVLLAGVFWILVIESASLAVCASGLARLCVDHASSRSCRNLAGLMGPWSHIVSMTVWIALVWPHWASLERAPNRGRVVRRDGAQKT